MHNQDQEEQLEPYAPYPISLAPSNLRFGSWFQKRQGLAHALAWLAIFALIIYLTWRLVFTSRGVSLWAFSPLFLAELYGFITYLIFLMDTWDLPEMPRLTPLKLSCDIVIPTYDEDFEILEPTIIGALEVRGLTTVWVLDDTRRPEIAALAKRYGVNYRTRPDNTHAKAGNINAALPDFKSELILIIDADHVPAPDFLEATTGYFIDPHVALVQTAHSFRNLNSIAHDNGGRNEQSLFFDVIMPGKNRVNAVLWCGSAAILRRSALVAIGGLSTMSIIEDFETSLQLRRAGYKCVYHNEHLIQGLAPDNLASLIIQRHRWAKGMFQLFHPKVRLPFRKELGFTERISYAGGLFYYLGPLQRIFYTLNLILVACFGFLPVGYVGRWFLILWVFATVFNLISVAALMRGTTHPFEGTRNSFIVMEAYLTAIPALWGSKSAQFKVTPKNQVDLGGWSAVKLLRIPIFMTGFTFVAMVIGWINFLIHTFTDYSFGTPLSLYTIMVITFFGSVEIIVIARTVSMIYYRKQYRALWRFPVRLDSKIEDFEAQCIDLHQNGAAFIVKEKVVTGKKNFAVSIRVKNLHGQIHIAKGTATIRSIRKIAADQEQVRVGTSIEWDNFESRTAIILHCYVVEQYVARMRFWVRRDTRFAVNMDALISGISATCRDLSSRGAAFTVTSEIAKELKVGMSISVEIGDGLSGLGTVQSVQTLENNELRIGVEVVWVEDQLLTQVKSNVQIPKKKKHPLSSPTSFGG